MLKQLLTVICLLALARPLSFAQSENSKLEIPAGTEIQLSLRDPVSSKLSEAGDEVIATVRRDVVVDGRTVLRQGTEIIGRVTLAEAAKRPLKGGRLHVTFDRIKLEGQEQKITTVIRSASDYSRDEKVKTDGEGTLKGGKDGGRLASNVGTAVGLSSVGVTIAVLARASDRGYYSGLGAGTVATSAAILGAGVVIGILVTKGKEIRLDENTIIRLKLERPIAIG